MQHINDYILEKIQINSKSEVTQGVDIDDIKIKTLSFESDMDAINILNDPDGELHDAVSFSDNGTYTIDFEIDSFGEFNATFSYTGTTALKVNVKNSLFKKGNVQFWLDAFKVVIDEYLANDEDDYSWMTEAIEPELKKIIK